MVVVCAPREMGEKLAANEQLVPPVNVPVAQVVVQVNWLPPQIGAGPP
jgi:hypothetical protein